MKFKLILLLLVLCIALTSCNLFVKKAPDNTTPSTESTTSPSGGNLSHATCPSDAITITTVEEYEKEYQRRCMEGESKTFLPPAEFLNSFGTLDRLIIANSNPVLYEFSCSSEFTYELYIEPYPISEPRPPLSIDEVELAEPPQGDLRYCPNNQTGRYLLIEDLVYCYDNGTLSSVEWYSNYDDGVVVCSSGYFDNEFHLYPYDDDNVISRLLNKSTAFEAMMEINKLFSGK